MKRIISALLTVAMLVTLITVPMMVTADAWSKPATYTHTNELLNSDWATLYAVKGTPDVDGIVDDAWADAYTLRVDYSTMMARGASKARMNTFMDIYMMWDEDNLYILEVREYDSVKYKAGCLNFWSGDNSNCYLITLPTAFTDDGVANDGASCMTNVHVGNATEKGVPAEGYVSKQTKYFKNNSAATTTVSYAMETKATTYTTITDNGFLMETAISWDALDDYTPGFSAAADMILGLGMYYKPVWQDNGNHAGYVDDAVGHQAVRLLGEGVKNPTPDPIKPDFSWYNANEDTYEIWDAADLIGLLNLSHLHSGSPLKTALVGDAAFDTYFTGKTIKIMADIDLNPGTIFNADGTFSGTAPRTGWSCLQDFKGTIDGQGHTISGLYCYNGMTAGTNGELRYIGLVGRGGAGLTIKDLSLTNGYLGANKTTSNQSAASFLAVAHHYNGAGTMTLENLYSDLYLYGSEFTGGIVGSTWFDNTLVWDVDNCVFAGATLGKNAGTLMGRDSAHAGKNSGTINNCYVPVGTKAISSDNSAVVETGDQAYIQTTDVDANYKVNARLLGVIDAADLASIDSVGMKVTVTHTDLSTSTKTTYDTKVLNGIKGVFETINADGVEINVSEKLSGDYAYGVVLKNIPAGPDDQVTIKVVITRVVDGVELESVCSYNATLVSGVAQPQ